MEFRPEFWWLFVAKVRRAGYAGVTRSQLRHWTAAGQCDLVKSVVACRRVGLDTGMNDHPELTVSAPLVPGHPSWGTFFDRLQGAEGCNFREDEWTCFGDHRACIAILTAMGLAQPTITATLSKFKALGGYCDCEVVLNVGGRWRR